uniref:Uncharacterized protein n=1 Tax=Caenorhabditis japonica TaxID=281687 RepID=A0A8R1ICE1_CAEJA
MSYQLLAEKQRPMQNGSPEVNEFDERHRQQGIDAARALANQYRSRITESKDFNQRQAARELSRSIGAFSDFS